MQFNRGRREHQICSHKNFFYSWLYYKGRPCRMTSLLLRDRLDEQWGHLTSDHTQTPSLDSQMISGFQVITFPETPISSLHKIIPALPKALPSVNQRTPCEFLKSASSRNGTPFHLYAWNPILSIICCI